MSRDRVRITPDPDTWRRALYYAAETHRTPSMLVEEALEQMMTRYPKRPRRDENNIDALASKVAEILATRVPAGTSTGKGAGG